MVMFASPNPLISFLGPCDRLQHDIALQLESGNTNQSLFAALAAGETARFNLARLFARRERNLAIWFDDANEPREIVGYLDQGLLDNPESKFRIVEITVRGLSATDWGTRTPTDIESIVPWIAKYCRRERSGDPGKEDHGWQRQGPYTAIFPIDDLPAGPLSERLANLRSGMHPIEIEEVDDVPELRASMISGASALHGFSWLGSDRIRLDPLNPLPADTIYFYPAPAPYVISGFRAAIRDFEPNRENYHYHPYWYDADARSIVSLNRSVYFAANDCTAPRKVSS
jgi:hypothetical protein